MKAPLITPRRKLWLWVTTIALVAVFIADIFISNGLGKSAALYIGIPGLVALTVAATTTKKSAVSTTMQVVTIGLALSVPLLKEGFICVLMAAPIIYATAAIVAKAVDGIINRPERNKFGASAALALVSLAAMEGSLLQTATSTEHMVSRSTIVHASADDVRLALSGPPTLGQPRPAFLRIFPEPVGIEGGGIDVGDQITFEFVYAKWIVANEHRGSTTFEVMESDARHVRFGLVNDTSYLSNYLAWQDYTITLAPMTDGTTRIDLTIRYERQLAPSWYFGPMQAYAVDLTAGVLLSDLAGLARGSEL